MMQESGGNPKAVSQAGARGLMQLMPGTAQELGVLDPFDPDQNMKGGTEYLGRQFANVRLALDGHDVPPSDVARLALASYNGGFGYVREAIRKVSGAGSVPTWDSVKASLPNITFRGKRPDHRQMIGYAERICPETPTVPGP